MTCRKFAALILPAAALRRRNGGTRVRRHLVTALVAGAAAGATAVAIGAILLAGGDEPALGEDAIREITADHLAEILDPALSEEAVREIAAAHIAEALADLDPALNEQIVDAYAHAAPSIVVIDAEGEEIVEADGTASVPAALATGIVFDSDGHVLTAAHVIEGMTKFRILTPDGERRPAERISDDAPYTDVAVLRTGTSALIPARFDREPPAHGETVLAIGNTLLGESISVTAGIVSNPDASFARPRINLTGLIQTDAALNYGNSGGALVSLEGRVIGLTTFVARETRDGRFVDGVGFALPIGPALEIAETIARDGYYPRPTFGVVNERLLTPAAAEQLDLDVSSGSFLIEIKSRGVFARAGIRPGDVVREINGTAINPETPFLNAMMALRPGVAAEVVIRRGGRNVRHSLVPERRLP